MLETEKQLENRIISAAENCIRKSAPYFTKFLTESEQTVVKRLKLPLGADGFFCAGEGNTQAIRQCFGIFPSDYEYTHYDAQSCFPITAVTFSFRKCDVITNRDVLGTLMGLGIERNTVGDIYVVQGAAAVYVTVSVANLILQSVQKIGRVGVKCEEGLKFDIPKRQYEDIKLSVSSLRLDTLTAQLTNISRTACADKYIRSQLVSVNSVVCDSCSVVLSQGDIITIRGKGKFVLHEIGGTGRKGNIHITVKKYI